ncbi:hypothetical protein LCGC14_0364140 [marine sediment metagenome]|uniref:Uncharacterized protein n=1 Tax=marine sediment metagenome TaxID=412755 RepID=A0A0F9T756_9ZZZZ
MTNPVRDLYNVVVGTVTAGKPVVPDEEGGLDTFKAKKGSHLGLQVQSNDKQVRINHRSYDNATGDTIGYTSKPNQTVTTTGDVYGAQMQPRVQAAVGANRLVGYQAAPIIKGSSGVSGTITNGVQCFRAELTDEAGAGKTFSDDLVGFDVRGIAMVSGHTFDSNVHTVGFRMASSENSKTWDAVLKLSGTQGGVWNDDPTTELNLPGGTVKGYIKVIVNNVNKYIALYDIGNLAD